MNRQSLPIGHVFGIPVGIDLSWFLVFALVTWSLATGYFPKEYQHWSAAAYWLIGGLTALLFFGSVFLHELAHSVVAERFKIPVRKITLHIFGGVSEMSAEAPTAWSEFWITISGPITNLILAGLFYLLTLATPTMPPLQALVKYLAYINLILGLFNLIPGYPLDGGSVLMAVIWGVTRKRRWGIVAAATLGSLVAYALIMLGVFQLLGGSVLNGLWTAFIGWFLLNASGGAVRQERLKGLLSGHLVADAMSKNFTIVYPETSLQDLFDQHILGGSRRTLIIKQGDQIAGLLTQNAIQAVPKTEWESTTVAQVMVPAAQLITTQPSTELYSAIEKMDSDGVNQLPVIANGQIQGMLTREDVISYLRRLQNIEIRQTPTV